MAPSYEVIELLDTDDETPAKCAFRAGKATSAAVQLPTSTLDLSAEFDDSVFNEFNDDLLGKREDLQPQRGTSNLLKRGENTRVADTATYLQSTRPTAESINGLSDWFHPRPLKRRRLTPPRPDEEDEVTNGRSLSRAVDSKAKKAYVTLPGGIEYSKLWSDPLLLDDEENSRPPINLQSRDVTDSDIDDLDDIFEVRTGLIASHPELSGRTVALLANISNASKPEPRRKPTIATDKDSKTTLDKKSGRRRVTDTSLDSTSDGSPGKGRQSRHAPADSRKTRVTSAERLAKQQEKNQLKLQKLKEKESEKEWKRLEKEEKARQKQVAADIAEVNKVKIDKANSTPEMIVDLPNSIKGMSLLTQIQKFFENLEISSSFYESSVRNVIKWRRKVVSSFNEELGQWERVQERICKEKHILCLVTATEFVNMVAADPSENGLGLETHVLRVKSDYEGCVLVYLIEGLNAFMRKNKASRNRAHEEQVRNQMPVQASESTSKRKKQLDAVIDEDLIEDALLRLQVMHGCLIHHTAAPVETAEWVVNFTQHISTIPYKYVFLSCLPELDL